MSDISSLFLEGQHKSKGYSSVFGSNNGSERYETCVRANT